MKKIGIITFHNSYNCGSMLETYAIQKYLQKKDLENEIIDFSTKAQKELYDISFKNNSIKNIIKNILLFPWRKKVKINNNQYEQFKSKNFKLSSDKYDEKKKIKDNYSIVVAGSDQIWNITISDSDDAYFLPWVTKARKVAYAPSFGAQNILKVSSSPEKYKKYIVSFDALSVREKNGQKWIKDLTGRKAELLIDPTLLLSQEDYSSLKKNLKSIDLQEIKTLRVDTSKLDNLISQTGELLINGIKTREHIIELSKINSKIVKWNAVSKKIINYLKYLEKKGFFNSELDDSASMFYKRAQDFFVNNAEIINEINNDFTRLYNIISEDDNKLHQTAMEIEIIAKGIRVLPLATLFHSFPRMMRDIANENNKKIDFIISGSDTTVDKKIIEEIKMPLIHILRNSVSHGIETPEQRLKNNKKETGIVKLTAKQVENNVIITIEDDGYGVDIEKVKEIAIKKALLTDEEISNMSNEQLMKLLFLPGFSTEESINEISGRGIGLDIVKTKITNLNGDIIIDSILNKGCKVTIKLPLSMSTIKTFILLVNNQKYAIPVNSIKFVKKISKEEIFMRNGMNCIIYEDHSIPVYYLSEVFGEINNLDKETQLTVIIIENQEKQAAYVIDKLLGDHEVFQKKLIPPILRIRNISGFTTLSTGEICLIINPFELIRNTVSSLHISSSAIKQIPIEED